MLQCKLKFWRMKLHISQNELSQKSGIAQSEISDIESFNKSPTLGTVCKLAEAMGVCPKNLMHCDILDCVYIPEDCCNKNSL